mmetsp:Transcript_252/g.421  ORF Transcript_252/g.421 Transcript_252/m.421 type:complete len:214 (-) Transcript_252:367-1008(-)
MTPPPPPSLSFSLLRDPSTPPTVAAITIESPISVMIKMTKLRSRFWLASLGPAGFKMELMLLLSSWSEEVSLSSSSSLFSLASSTNIICASSSISLCCFSSEECLSVEVAVVVTNRMLESAVSSATTSLVAVAATSSSSSSGTAAKVEAATKPLPLFICKLPLPAGEDQTSSAFVGNNISSSYNPSSSSVPTVPIVAAKGVVFKITLLLLLAL